MSDDDRPTIYATQEEAIAAAMAESEPGDIVEIHDSGCAAQVDEDCDCTPLVLTVRESEQN